MADFPQDRLDSWKDIAAYLGRDVSTVLRWKKQKGLPIHRLPGGQRAAIYAYKSEIDAWMAGKPAGQQTAMTQESFVTADQPVITPEKPEAPSGEPDILPAGAYPSASGTLSKPENSPSASAAMAKLISGQRSPWLFMGIGLFLAIFLVLKKLAVPSSAFISGYRQLTSDGFPKKDVLTDGRSVYFAETTPQGNIVARTILGSDTIQTLSAAFQNPHLLSINPARSEILLSDLPMDFPGRLWLLPLAGGRPRRLGHIRSLTAVLSPDGGRIAFALGRQLWLCYDDGSGEHRLTTLPHQIDSIAWDPSGERLRLILRKVNSGAFQIWDIHADGSNLRPLKRFAGQSGFDQFGLWGPDRSYFYSNNGQLWFYPHSFWFPWLTHPHRHKIPLGPLLVESFASSPQPGTLLVNAIIARDRVLRYSLRQRQFVPWRLNSSADFPAPAPNHHAVVYAIQPQNRPLLEKNLITGDEIHLIPDNMEAEYPQWSPDGRQIAFIGRFVTFQPWHIYLVPAKGGQPRRLTRNQFPEGMPTWSPDGAQIVFGELGRYGSQPGPKATIHIVNVHTGVTDSLPGSRGLWTARWSPNGRNIAALSLDSKKIELYNLHTQKWTVLASGTGISDLRWSPDARDLYFLTLGGENGAELCRLNVAQKKVMPLTRLNFDSTGWLGLSAGGRPLLTQHSPDSEIFAVRYHLP